MTEYIHLVGAEDVARAGRNMQSAAETMSRAASQIEESNRVFLMRFEELISRMEADTSKREEVNSRSNAR